MVFTFEPKFSALIFSYNNSYPIYQIFKNFHVEIYINLVLLLKTLFNFFQQGRFLIIPTTFDMNQEISLILQIMNYGFERITDFTWSLNQELDYGLDGNTVNFCSTVY